MKRLIIVVAALINFACSNNSSNTGIGVEGTNFIKGRVVHENGKGYQDAKVYLLKESDEVSLYKK